MGIFASYGILVLCICFVQAFGYERCTYGTYYHYCNTGSCCKISGIWYCTGSGHSRSDCDSFVQTTTTTTEAPSKSKVTTTTATEAPSKSKVNRTIYGTVSSIVFVALIAVVVVYYISYKRKHNHPSPVVRSTTIAVIYQV